MTKTQPELDDMIPHVRYEVLKIVDFLAIGNSWAYDLPAERGPFAGESILEAALVHTRCVAEFLSHKPRHDTITARDYIPGWSWAKGEGLKPDLAQIHGRVAHLGLIRRTVQRDGANFQWDEFLSRSAVPTLLEGFREFLRALDPEYAEGYARWSVAPRGNTIMECIELANMSAEKAEEETRFTRVPASTRSM